MPMFRKKPVVIEAMQYLGPSGMLLNVDQAVVFDDWIAANQGDRKCRYSGERFIIPTLEGDHEARPGDWIIRGIKGELYPCRSDIFDATYDPA